MASGSNAKGASGVPGAAPGENLGLQWVEFQFLPLPHHKAIQSTLNCTVLANCLCQELNTFYSQHHKDSSVQQCQKCLGILLGFVYISLDVVHTIFSYIKDFHRIYH